MDTFDKVLIAIAVTGTLIALISLSCRYVTISSKVEDLEKRVLVLETRINIYAGRDANG